MDKLCLTAVNPDDIQNRADLNRFRDEAMSWVRANLPFLQRDEALGCSYWMTMTFILLSTSLRTRAQEVLDKGNPYNLELQVKTDEDLEQMMEHC